LPTVKQGVVFSIDSEALMDNPLNELGEKGKVGYWPVVTTFFWIEVFLLQQWSDDCLLQLLRHTLLKGGINNGRDPWTEDIWHLLQ
jgi:hypothetical protein